MRIHTTRTSTLLLLAAMLLVIVGSVSAGPPAEEPDAAVMLAGPVAGKISYQGQLTDGSGNPLNGNYNLLFQLWDAETAGSQVGSDIVMSNVPVSGGLFTVQLPVNTAHFTGQALWLRVQVNGQWLAPRQELLPVPYALSLRPGAGIFGDESFSGVLNVDNQGTAPALLATAGAVLFDIPTSQVGVFGAGRDGGVMGFSDGTGRFGGVFFGDAGVSGAGQSGPGGAFSSIDGTGIDASSTNDVAVYATAGTIPLILITGHQAVVAYGEDNGIVAWGGQTGGSFTGGTGVSATGGTRGVHGMTDSTAEGAAGVFGESTNMLADGLRGQGVHGVHGIGFIGVFGEGDVGVSGEGIVGVGGKSETNSGAGVHGEATGLDGVGVRGTSDFGAGVQGTGEKGVAGSSPVGFGVWGEGPTGVRGTSTTDAGTGVYGIGPAGVYGESNTDFGEGVHGHGTGSNTEGVLGTSTSGVGVWGVTSSSWGLGTPQNLWVGGGCTGCTVSFVARNADAGRLDVGDPVVIAGIAPPLKGQHTPVLTVRRATSAARGGLGVVLARAVVGTQETPLLTPDSGQAETLEMAGLAPGLVEPGEYLFVVVQGLAQVRADTSAGPIQVGDLLAPGTVAGPARRLAPNAAPAEALGRALEPLAGGEGLIWVLVLGR